MRWSWASTSPRSPRSSACRRRRCAQRSGRCGGCSCRASPQTTSRPTWVRSRSGWATSSTPRPTSWTRSLKARSRFSSETVTCSVRAASGPGDPKEDFKIVCPCIPFFRDEFAALGKCWCGLFIRTDIEDGAELIGVIEEPEPGTSVEVPVCRLEDLAENTARHFKIGKSDVAVVRMGDEVFALSNVLSPRLRAAVRGLRRGPLAGVPVAWVALRRSRRDDRPSQR